MTEKTYRHWQSGTLIRVVILAALVAIGAVTYGMLRDGVPWYLVLPPIVVVSLVLVGCLVAFNGLGTEVTRKRVFTWFGPGWISRQIEIDEISDVRRVRNRWWMGWGVRWIDQRTALWCVSGLDAVELELRTGRQLRIGTDDPEGLAGAIRDSLPRSR